MIHTQWKFAEEEICRRVSAIMQETQAVGLAISILEGENKPRRMFFWMAGPGREKGNKRRFHFRTGLHYQIFYGSLHSAAL